MNFGAHHFVCALLLLAAVFVAFIGYLDVQGGNATPNWTTPLGTFFGPVKEALPNSTTDFELAAVLAVLGFLCLHFGGKK